MRPSRRNVLQGVAGAGVLSAFGVPMIRHVAAADLKERYFIFCYFKGGWDLLISLDPRDPAEFRSDLRKVTRIDPGYDQLASRYRSLVETSVPGMVYGPCIGRLADHADKTCLIRGMSMETLTHEVGRRRFITGRAPSGLQARGSSAATVLASYLGQEQAIPQLSVLVESYNSEWPSYASAIRVSSVDDLVRALGVSPNALPAEQQAALDAMMVEVQGCKSTDRSDFYRTALEHRSASQQLVALGLDEAFDFSANTAEMEALRDRYGIDPEDLAAAPAQAAAAVTAITSGISRCVSIEAATDLDHHGPEWSSSHGPRLEAGFDLIAAMIEDLESREFGNTGESWLDRTTILGFSEFGRTPLINSSGGRDHYLHNACFLVGGGVRGGVVLGASSDVGMAPLAMDLSTGALDEQAGEVVKPENVFRAILTEVGITEDAGELNAEPLTAIYG